MDNVPPFDLIPWVLGQCASVEEAKALLERVNLTDRPFREDLPLTPLHWMIADRERSLVAEPMAEGLRLYENPADVMTNNPPFPDRLERGETFSRLLPDEPEGRQDSRGMGAVGLPGDWSSSSRFGTPWGTAWSGFSAFLARRRCRKGASACETACR